MKNLIDDIQEFQNIILNDDQIVYNYKNKNIGDLKQSVNNNVIGVDPEEKKNEENKTKSYSEYYKPILDAMAFRQNIQKIKEEKKNSGKGYKNYIIDNPKNKERKNNFNLEEEFGSSSNAFNKTNYSSKYNKTKYQNSSNKNRYKIIEEFKNKYFGNDEYTGYLNLLKQNNIAVKLNNMHNLISGRIKKEDRFHPNSYKNIINNMQKEIDIIRKERKKENIFFDKTVKQLQKDFFNIENNNSRKKIKSIKNNYLKKSKTKNKRNFSNKGKTQSNFGRSYNKSKINNNYENTDYIIKSKKSTLNKNKSLPNKFFKKNNKITKSPNKNNNKNKNLNIEQLYCQKIIKEIKELNKENEIIENKYKNIGFSNDNIIKNINSLIEKNNNNGKSFNNIDYKKKEGIIKKNINLISNKIINDILLECIVELTNIENQRTEKGEKEKLKSKLNSIIINIEEYKQKEKDILQEYNNKKNIKEEIKCKEIILPSKIRYYLEIDKDIIERCDKYQWKFLDYMILKGSFYSDFNIFKIYDLFVEEMSEIIMKEEIDKIINKTDQLIDNICHEEINEIK